VTPFTQAIGLPDPFARRVARNTQLVLIEESRLGFVSDPAAGAGGFEALTQALCERAWDLFKDMDRAGGLAAALALGAFQGEVAAARGRRRRAVATRKLQLTGVSEFPDLHEDDIKVLAPIPTIRQAENGLLAPMRDAEPFEILRDESDRRAARDARPKVFLACLGPASAFTARAAFARGFFEAGGIAAVSSKGFDEPQRLAAAFRDSDAPLACLCSSDAVYAERAVAAVRALGAAGARRIYLAGRPGALEDALRAAGVEEFVFAGVDSLAVLQRAFTFCD
jgi:methylmalonyl-CoA mutase